jgi:hypothetical protein
MDIVCFVEIIKENEMGNDPLWIQALQAIVVPLVLFMTDWKLAFTGF